jgi:hypothetical protein
VGSDALGGFKDIITHDRFYDWFPVLPLEVDNDIRLSYKGGFTYLNPKYRNKRLQGCVFDVNSLYPSVMYSESLPFGHPLFFQGQYEDDPFFPLYIQRLSCAFQIKPGHIPTIQLKRNMRFTPTEYLTSSKREIVELTLTSVDLELFLEHYDVELLEYKCGWMFRSCTGVFCKYIDHWNDIKMNSEGGKRYLAKLQLNSLYGKFATNPRGSKKSPYLKDDVVKYTIGEEEIRDPVYTAIGSFITAYARAKTIRTAQANYDRFIYADTDSVHLEGYDLPDIEIHPTAIGAWKHEGNFTEGKFLRAKTYMETIDGITHVVCAGMPDQVKKGVTYDNFTYGAVYHGKLTPKRHPGGIVLHDIDFTIKKD